MIKRKSFIDVTVTTPSCILTAPFGLYNDPGEIKKRAKENFYNDIADGLWRGYPLLGFDNKSEMTFDSHGMVADSSPFISDDDWDAMDKAYKDKFPSDEETLEDVIRWFDEEYDPEGRFYKNSGIDAAIDLMAILLKWKQQSTDTQS